MMPRAAYETNVAIKRKRSRPPRSARAPPAAAQPTGEEARRRGGGAWRLCDEELWSGDGAGVADKLHGHTRVRRWAKVMEGGSSRGDHTPAAGCRRRLRRLLRRARWVRR